MALSKQRRSECRRYLPHLQNGVQPLFVSMTTRQQWELPPAARTIGLEHILRENEARIQLYAAVVMPDHVHSLFSPLEDQRGQPFGLAEIMNGMRGPSAHRINRLLQRHGAVWEEEFFDRLPRYGEFDGCVDYIVENPVKVGLVKRWEDYPWLWLHEQL